MLKQKSKIIFLAGTSGTGKSTIATNLRLKIGDNARLLSTDSIRQVLRCYQTKDQCPIIFPSTYKLGGVEGFLNQCSII